jgi:hypothetical protein
MKAETVRQKTWAIPRLYQDKKWVFQLQQTPQYCQIMRKLIMQMKSTSFPSFKNKPRQKSSCAEPRNNEFMALWVILIKRTRHVLSSDFPSWSISIVLLDFNWLSHFARELMTINRQNGCFDFVPFFINTVFLMETPPFILVLRICLSGPFPLVFLVQKSNIFLRLAQN